MALTKIRNRDVQMITEAAEADFIAVVLEYINRSDWKGLFVAMRGQTLATFDDSAGSIYNISTQAREAPCSAFMLPKIGFSGPREKEVTSTYVLVGLPLQTGPEAQLSSSTFPLLSQATKPTHILLLYTHA